jgi:hypothetical protein
VQGTGPGIIWGAVPEFTWPYQRESRRSEDNQSSGRDLNLGPPGYEAGTLTSLSCYFGDAEMNMGCLNGLTEVTVASMYGNKD